MIRESGDIETEFEFGNWEENPALPESEFHFEPPAGVAIVDQSDLALSIH
jgi:outer membrane lipoprotein-sorting protein